MSKVPNTWNKIHSKLFAAVHILCPSDTESTRQCLASTCSPDRKKRRVSWAVYLIEIKEPYHSRTKREPGIGQGEASDEKHK